jgi:hypothetical protein
MPQKHPHIEAAYRVVALEDGGFGVEVTIPDSAPTMVTRFAVEADADAWIDKHRQKVQTNPTLNRIRPRFRRPA